MGVEHLDRTQIVVNGPSVLNSPATLEPGQQVVRDEETQIELSHSKKDLRVLYAFRKELCPRERTCSLGMSILAG